MTTNFCQEQLPCGCMPGYRRCEVAERLLREKEEERKKNIGKRSDDPCWQRYHDIDDEYLIHIQREPVARLLA